MKARHRRSQTAEYHAWDGMKQRCGNERHPAWGNYGGRGIKVCERWVERFEAFLEDVGERPSGNHQIDRIDNDGDYEPGNVRWVECKTNMRNKQNNKMVEYCGARMTLADACEKAGIREGLVLGRMWNGRHTLEEAMAMPLRKRGRKQFVEWSGERISLGKLEKRLGFNKDVLCKRLSRGWTLEKACTVLPRVMNGAALEEMRCKLAAIMGGEKKV